MGLILLILAAPVDLTIEYERAKLLTYKEAHNFAMDTGRPLVVWSDQGSAKSYQDLKTLNPEVSQVFVKNFPVKGIILCQKGLDINGKEDLIQIQTFKTEQDLLNYFRPVPRVAQAPVPLNSFNYQECTGST